MRLPTLSHLMANSSLRRFVIIVHDLIVVASAFPASMLLRENFSLAPHHVLPTAYGTMMLLVIAAVVFRMAGLHQNMWRYSSPRDLLAVAKAISLVTAVFVPGMFLLDRLDGISRSVLVIFWFVAFAGLASSRIIYGCIVNPGVSGIRRPKNRTLIRVLIIGNAQSSAAIIQALNAQLTDVVQVVGVIGRPDDSGRVVHGVRILGGIESFPQIMASLDVSGFYPHQIVLGDVDSQTHAWLEANLTNETGLGATIAASNLSELERLSYCEPAHLRLFAQVKDLAGYHRLKRLIDIAIASASLTLLFPMLALVTALTSLFHGSPVIFSQVRAGQYMREFKLIKFRTMREPFDRLGRILDDEKRITWLGAFLRNTRLDELPQLWNVLCGDMSVIGPRPLLRRDMPTQNNILQERYLVKPGITGWAQVNGGHQLSKNQKMALDLFYIRNASFALDVKILALTFRMMLRGERIDRAAITRAQTAIALN